jgi:hypothetical protein
MMTHEEMLANEVDPEFQAIWNAQLLEYPTISRGWIHVSSATPS